LVHHTTTGKRYQMTRKYTRWPENIPDDQKIFQMTRKYPKAH
jgi:hypothetical protein